MATINGFYKTPWFIGGGAVHTPEVARNFASNATGRTHGIIGTPDLKVTQLDVPGTAVKIATGSAVIRVRNTQAAQQSYDAFAETTSQVDVVATGSGAGRSDLVILRVEDPYIAGSTYQSPADPTTATFVRPLIIQGVPAGTTTLAQAGRGGDSAIVLARIDLPASTGTVTNAMITDLRTMAMPRQETQTNFNQNATGPNTLTSTTFTPWPGYEPANIVPEWATHAQARFWMSGVYTPGPCDGGIRLELWGPNGQNIIYGPEQRFDQDVPIPAYSPGYTGSTGGGATRFSLSGALYGRVDAFRGQPAAFRLAAYKLNRADRAPITVDTGTSLVFDVTFYERPI